MSLEYWYMFPVAIAVSTVSIASGVAGATFFTPIFLLWLGLPLRVAIGSALITATFGFASGLYGYTRRGLIDYRLGFKLAAASIPMALVGVWLSGKIRPDLLRLILGVGLLAIAVNFLRASPSAHGVTPDDAAAHDAAASRGVNGPEGVFFAGLGGLFLGMISAGLGELNAYFLMQRSKIPSDVAVATSVLAVAVTVLAAAGGHLVSLFGMGPDVLETVASLVLFTIPGVIIGAQIGCTIASRVPHGTLIRALGVLFVIVAGMVVLPLLLA